MSVHRPWSHQTQLAAEASSGSRARAFVTGHLVDHGMAGLVEDVELVVSELATNAVVHAGSPFTVTLGASEETVLLEVLDRAHTSPTLVANHTLETSGRGIAIMQAVSRDWGVSELSSGGKSVWAVFDIDSALVDEP
jgi:anti-sigma regulatory factor (Ser/Thr protein kinase)